jgi:adenosylcobinamide amidohydrolase
VIEEILTSIIVKHRTLKSAKWKEGKGKKVQYFINKRIIQSKTIGRGMS